MANPNLVKGAPALPGAGRPPGSGNKSKASSLRKTLKKLKSFEEKAIQNIEDSVNGKEVDKEQLASSKWLVTSVVTVQKACLAEEQFKESLNDEDEEKEPVVEKPKFSLNIVNKI